MHAIPTTPRLRTWDRYTYVNGKNWKTSSEFFVHVGKPINIIADFVFWDRWTHTIGISRTLPLDASNSATLCIHRTPIGKQDHHRRTKMLRSAPLRSMVRAQLPRNRARDSFVASSPGHPGFLVVATAIVLSATPISFHLLGRSRATFRSAGYRMNGVRFVASDDHNERSLEEGCLSFRHKQLIRYVSRVRCTWAPSWRIPRSKSKSIY